MQTVIHAHPFLILSLVLCAIGLLMAVVRRDLRRMAALSATAALPFAFTEPLFYPEYWSPPFLFDLAQRIGFGVEDFLFVAALAAIASMMFPVVTGARLHTHSGPRSPHIFFRRAGGLLAAVGAGTALSWAAGLPAIYAAPLLMAGALAYILALRRDLAGIAVGAGLLTGLLYGVVLGALDRAGGGLIEHYWHAHRFFDLSWSGLPAEEWLYGFGAGALGAVFYPYASGLEFRVPGAPNRAPPAAWLQSLRWPAQAYIFFPLLLGQTAAVRTGNRFDMAAALWLHLYGVLIHAFIVWANDYADEAVDRLNRTPTLFSGGSRVLPDGLLSARHLRSAVRWSMMAGALAAAGLSILHGRHGAPLFLAVSWGLLWAYSFPPFRASYRGYGELLQMLGVGLVLPLFGFYVQGGSPAQFPLWLLAAILPTQLACALSTAMPDAPSDRAGGKRTLWILLSPRVGMRLIILLHGISILIAAARAIRAASPVWPVWLLFLPLLWALTRVFPRATPGTRAIASAVTISISITVLLMLSLHALAVG